VLWNLSILHCYIFRVKLLFKYFCLYSSCKWTPWLLFRTKRPRTWLPPRLSTTLPSSLNKKVYFNFTAVGPRRVTYQRLKSTQQPSALTSTIPKFCCSSPTGCSISVPAYSNPSNVCTSCTIVYIVFVSAKSSVPHVSPTVQRWESKNLRPWQIWGPPWKGIYPYELSTSRSCPSSQRSGLKPRRHHRRYPSGDA